jgi:predicted DNA-binding transcriptional regulator YafY
MRFEEEHNGVEFILGFGDQVEVVAPDNLRAKVIQQAAAVLARYAQADAPSNYASSDMTSR